MATQVTTDFDASPAQFLEETIKAYIRESPDNCFKDIDGSPIYDEPLVGFADGDDPLFLRYKDEEVIGDFHLTPREALEKHLREEVNVEKPRLGEVSVVSWVLPLDRATRVSNRVMTDGPSLRWNHNRWHGETLNNSLASHVVSLLGERGYLAVAPGRATFFHTVKLPSGMASIWSERHVAYAAGLGTFSLTDALITAKGLAMRCGSVVTDLKLSPSPRTYPSHTANCCFLEQGTCGLCAIRCPVGAITIQGHDKIRCREYLFNELAPWLEKEGYIGRYPGCGLCMTGVPCEAGIPGKVAKRFIP
jgi:epoxyqueuosine reductase QueG